MELVDTMARTRVNIICLQETKGVFGSQPKLESIGIRMAIFFDAFGS